MGLFLVSLPPLCTTLAAVKKALNRLATLYITLQVVRYRRATVTEKPTRHLDGVW